MVILHWEVEKIMQGQGVPRYEFRVLRFELVVLTL
jgi:hypothetical protein